MYFGNGGIQPWARNGLDPNVGKHILKSKDRHVKALKKIYIKLEAGCAERET